MDSIKKKGVNIFTPVTFQPMVLQVAGDAATYKVNEIGEADDEPAVGRNNCISFIDFVFFEEISCKC